MKRKFVAVISMIGFLTILSACASEKSITFPTNLDSQYYCSVDAKADFHAAESAYESGNFEKSFNLFNKASEKNCANADFYLGVQYHNGQFVAKDLTLSKAHFKNACDKGLKTACSYK